MGIERNFFGDEKTFVIKMLEVGIKGGEIRNILKHERKHFRKAVEKGYSPFYLLEMKTLSSGLRICGFGTIVGNTTQEDLKEIAGSCPITKLKYE